MKNIILVKDKIIPLPYIIDIDDIIFVGNRITFTIKMIESFDKMIESEIIELTPKWGGIFNVLFEKYKKDNEYFKSEEFDFNQELLDKIDKEYDNIVKIREELIKKWDKYLEKIEKI